LTSHTARDSVDERADEHWSWHRAVFFVVNGLTTIGASRPVE